MICGLDDTYRAIKVINSNRTNLLFLPALTQVIKTITLHFVLINYCKRYSLHVEFT